MKQIGAHARDLGLLRSEGESFSFCRFLRHSDTSPLSRLAGI